MDVLLDLADFENLFTSKSDYEDFEEDTPSKLPRVSSTTPESNIYHSSFPLPSPPVTTGSTSNLNQIMGRRHLPRSQSLNTPSPLSTRHTLTPNYDYTYTSHPRPSTLFPLLPPLFPPLLPTHHISTTTTLNENLHDNMYILNDDCLFSTFSFLTPSELRVMAGTSKFFKTSCEAWMLWLPHCIARWPLMEMGGGGDRIVYHCHSHSHSQLHDDNRKKNEKIVPQYNILHAISPSYPTRLNYEFIEKHPLQFECYDMAVNATTKSKLKSKSNVKSNSGEGSEGIVSVVQYTGEIGIGDRCIRSSVPFPFLKAPRLVQPVSALLSSSSSSSSSIISGNAGDGDGSESEGVIRERTRKRSFGSIAAERLIDFMKGGNCGDRDVNYFKQRTTTGANSNTNINNTKNKMSQRQRQSQAPKMQAFVSPLVSKEEYKQDGGIGRVVRFVDVDVTPRLIAYFEVSIHAKIETDDDDDDDDDEFNSNNEYSTRSSRRRNNSTSTSTSTSTNQTTPECLAIGLSTPSFTPTSQMPGWCRHSFGYHGDDGGIFHETGDMIDGIPFGPRFGGGDVVGCGIDYHYHRHRHDCGSTDDDSENGRESGRIFYTLNGNFLGYAFKNIAITTQFYPTIGIDCNSPIEVNFGKRAFMFDWRGLEEEGRVREAGRERIYTM